MATASRLERQGYNFSLGLAQVNRHNLAPQGLADYATAFATCPNLAAGARILADCHRRAGGDWGKAFSCYYSGNFTRGFRDGYVDKVRRSMAASVNEGVSTLASAIPVIGASRLVDTPPAAASLRARRSASAAQGAPAATAVSAALQLAVEGRGGVPVMSLQTSMPMASEASSRSQRRAMPMAPASPAAPGPDPNVVATPFVPQVSGPGVRPETPPPASAPASTHASADSAFVF